VASLPNIFPWRVRECLAILALRLEANARSDQIALADAQPEQFRLAPAVGVRQFQEEAQPELTGVRGEPCVVSIFDEAGSRE